jgi:hypothetical protein
MHLVTGFLLTALLGRNGRGARPRLPSFPGILETVHVLPGRMRLRVPALAGDARLGEDVAKRLQRLEGIASATISSVTGSLLITFDPQQVEPEILLAAVIRLLGLEEQLERAPRSRLGHEIREMGAALNQAVHQQTGGMIDLWTGLPLVLAAVGIRNVLAKNGQLGLPLLWWAYVSLFPPGQNQS